MPCTNWELPVAEYIEGGGDAAERQRVEAHLAACPDCRSVVHIWKRLGDLPEERLAPSADFPSRFRRRLAAPGLSIGRMGWLAAAAALLMGIIGFTAGRASSRNSFEPSGDIAGLRKEVRNLREVVALSLLNQQSASDRLRGIQYSEALDAPDLEVVQALTHTLQSDPSINVRVAAAEALQRFTVPANLREPIWRLLESDESPLVQVAIVDLLSKTKDGAVRARLEALKGRQGLDPNVRNYLQAVLSNQRDRGNTFQ